VIYDGYRMVVHALPQGAWSKIEAPPSLDGVLSTLQERLGLPIDVGDLFVTDPYAKLVDDTTGEVVSPTEINGVPSWHLLLRSGDVPWEFWVRRDATALPVMASVVRSERRAIYRFDEWRLNPAIDSALFRFRPPPGAVQVPMVARREAQ
jgi:hypothetical protein